VFEQRLDVIDTQTLSQVCHITDGNHFAISEHFMDEGTYRYLRGQDLTDFFLQKSLDNSIFIPKEIFDGLRSSQMQPLNVLLSIVGTIGAVGIIPPDWSVVTGSCKLAILGPNYLSLLSRCFFDREIWTISNGANYSRYGPDGYCIG
jgi:hypothetical protein